jgi:2-dehydropantoate 2-reductase
VVLGEVTGHMTPRLDELHKLMLDFEPNAIATDKIWGYLWGKLGYGAMLFAQALGQKGIADCLARPELLPVWRALGREAVEVALAEGVEPKGFNGYDPAAFMPNAAPAAARACVEQMVAFNRPNAKTHSGVWRDLAIRKRRTEVDVQIAPIAEIGGRHGIACPTTAKLVDMIHQVEQGKRQMTDDNLLELIPT